MKKITIILTAIVIMILVLPSDSNAAITVDSGAMPVSGATQWHSASTPAFSQPVQFQVVRNIRATSTNLRLLYLNNTSKYITFLASVRKNFAGTPEMVTVGGTTTITMAPYSATTSDQLSFSVGTGDYVYDRSFFPTASSSQVFSSGVTLGTYNPETISVSGAISGYSLMGGYATTSTSRLLETNKTFEHDIAYEAIGNYEFGAYAVLGIPTDSTLRFTNLVGDSKTADFTQDVTSGVSKPWHMTGFGKKNGIPFQNLALPGDSLVYLVNPSSASPAASYQLRRSLLDAFPANTVNHYGTNSVDNGAVATTSTSLELSYVSQLKTIIGANNYLYQLTIDPVTRKTSTSSWSTITEADQSPAGDNNNGVATANYFNNFIKTQKPSYIDGVIDISSSVTTANGYWLPSMTGDGIHQGNTGNITQGTAFAALWPVATTTQVISSIAATSTASTTATITWNTSSAASRFVNFGLLSTYAASTTEAATSSRATSHSVSLSNLRPCTKYNFQVDGYSTYYVRATSSNQSFFTIGCTGSATVATSTDSNVITTASGGTFVFGTTTVTVPASFTSTSTSAVFQAKQLDRTAFVATAGTPSGKTQAGTYVLNLTALTDATTTLSTFNQPISVTLAYTDSDIAGLDTASLKIYRYDAGTGWTMLDNCTRDSVAKTVTCTTTHFSDFGIFGDLAPSDTGGFSTVTTIVNGVTYVTKGGVTTSYGSPIVASNTGSSQNINSSGVVIPNTSSLANPGMNQATSSNTTVTTTTTQTQTNSVNLTNAKVNFVKDLKLNSVDESVRTLQKLLNAKGFTVSTKGPGSSGNETNKFGPATRAALIKFQKYYNIKPSVGYFGPVTRKFIESLK